MMKNEILYQTKNPFKMTSFNTSEISTYVSVLTDAMHQYDTLMHEIYTKLLVVPVTNKDILHYIGYIYEAVMLTDRIGGLNKNRTLIERFIHNPDVSYTEPEYNIIYQVYYSASINLKNIKAHDIHSIPRFPCLPTITPISTSGIVGPSEIYINGLLTDCILYERLPDFVKTAVRTCVTAILRNSEPSDDLSDHYGHLLAHSGGFMKSQEVKSQEIYELETNSRSDKVHLGKTYLNYLYLHTDSIKEYNTIEIGKYKFIGNSYSPCYNKLKKIVETTGLLKREFQDYQQYVKDKQQIEQEKEDAKNSKSSPEFDAFVARLLERKKSSK